MSKACLYHNVPTHTPKQIQRNRERKFSSWQRMQEMLASLSPLISLPLYCLTHTLVSSRLVSSYALLRLYHCIPFFTINPALSCAVRTATPLTSP